MKHKSNILNMIVDEKGRKRRCEARVISELIEDEGRALKEYSEALANDWSLSEETMDLFKEIISEEKAHLVLLQERLDKVDKTKTDSDAEEAAEEILEQFEEDE